VILTSSLSLGKNKPMPFVTEYNTSLVLKKLIGGIPDDIRKWKPYRMDIYFLNRLDKTNLLYFKKFCESPIENLDEIYKPIEIKDSKEFVYQGGSPSYHKYETCERLHSNFVNFKIPEEIKNKGEEAVEEYRKWFKENQKIFLEKPDVFEMRLHTKYGIVTKIQQVNYRNSGNVYKEDLTLKEIDYRIGSLLKNAAEYYKKDEKRKNAIRRFQTATFLAFKEIPIEDNETGYEDDELKVILKEYSQLFIQPTMFYLKEFFKTYYNNDIEINEKIFEQLKFKKCGNCYSDEFEEESNFIDERNKILKERFGDYKFPIEPSKFYPKNEEGNNYRATFFYSRIFRCLDTEFKTDENGDYKFFKTEFIDQLNKFVYIQTKIYSGEIVGIQLFRKYLTKAVRNMESKEMSYTTYGIEI
jgi:hypothetical protein